MPNNFKINVPNPNKFEFLYQQNTTLTSTLCYQLICFHGENKREMRVQQKGKGKERKNKWDKVDTEREREDAIIYEGTAKRPRQESSLVLWWVLHFFLGHLGYTMSWQILKLIVAKSTDVGYQKAVDFRKNIQHLQLIRNWFSRCILWLIFIVKVIVYVMKLEWSITGR